MNTKRYFPILLIILLFSSKLFSQNMGDDWFTLPGFDPASPLTLTSEETFIGVIGLAALSYTLAEFVFKDEEHTNFYQVRTGMNKEYAWGLKNVWHQNFGVEHRVAPWFSLAAEFNLQEFNEKTPRNSDKNTFGMGAGLMTYYRWYLFGRKRLSPYLEYGTGLFYGFSKFPNNGTNFTFSHSTQIGLEYTFEKSTKLRLGYGNFHQSNNGWLEPNPSYDGDGFSIGFAWQLH